MLISEAATPSRAAVKKAGFNVLELSVSTSALHGCPDDSACSLAFGELAWKHAISIRAATPALAQELLIAVREVGHQKVISLRREFRIAQALEAVGTNVESILKCARDRTSHFGL